MGGDAGCSPGYEVNDERWCFEAIRHLSEADPSVQLAPFQLADNASFPPGCSGKVGLCHNTTNSRNRRETPYCGMFNTNYSGKGRLDSFPICRTTVPGREGGSEFEGV